jgi:hypothetical protein
MYTIAVEKDYLRILGDPQSIHVARSETGHNSGETAPEHGLQERSLRLTPFWGNRKATTVCIPPKWTQT